MKLDPAKVNNFRNMIFTWWKNNRRDLPWRHTRDPYHILVSEVMLQQTQVSRVLPKYQEFMNVYPDIRSLAKAPLSGVLRIWKGLGYNRRALYLKRTAEAVVTKYAGKFPEDQQLLTKLPGLGTYTARAIMVFAFEQNVAMVDTNIRQILTHFFFNGLPQKERRIEELAEAIVPAGKSWLWHQALMDYGALALPRGAVKRKITGKPVPFKDSDRFIRGKVVDFLREKRVMEDILIAHIVDVYGKTVEQCRLIITGLMDDELIIRKGRFLSLPD